MSENLRYQLQQMTNEELIDFALEHLGQEDELIRKAALHRTLFKGEECPKYSYSSSWRYPMLEIKASAAKRAN